MTKNIDPKILLLLIIIIILPLWILLGERLEHEKIDKQAVVIKYKIREPGLSFIIIHRFF